MIGEDNPHGRNVTSTASTPHAEVLSPGDGARAQFDLSKYSSIGYSPGRGLLIRALWYIASELFFEHGLFPVRWPKVLLLKAFGARVGKGLVIKPSVRIKFPWRLTIGDHCWIGESVWIDNLANVAIGDHVCVSQGAYLCTGSHDFRSSSFDLIFRPIKIGSGVWIAARAVILCGVTIGGNSIVTAGSVVHRNVSPGWIVSGNPARCLRKLGNDDAAPQLPST